MGLAGSSFSGVPSNQDLPVASSSIVNYLLGKESECAFASIYEPVKTTIQSEVASLSPELVHAAVLISDRGLLRADHLPLGATVPGDVLLMHADAANRLARDVNYFSLAENRITSKTLYALALINEFYLTLDVVNQVHDNYLSWWELRGLPQMPVRDSGNPLADALEFLRGAAEGFVPDKRLPLGLEMMVGPIMEPSLWWSAANFDEEFVCLLLERAARIPPTANDLADRLLEREEIPLVRRAHPSAQASIQQAMLRSAVELSAVMGGIFWRHRYGGYGLPFGWLASLADDLVVLNRRGLAENAIVEGTYVYDEIAQTCIAWRDRSAQAGTNSLLLQAQTLAKEAGLGTERTLAISLLGGFAREFKKAGDREAEIRALETMFEERLSRFGAQHRESLQAATSLSKALIASGETRRAGRVMRRLYELGGRPVGRHGWGFNLVALSLVEAGQIREALAVGRTMTIAREVMDEVSQARRGRRKLIAASVVGLPPVLFGAGFAVTWFGQVLPLPGYGHLIPTIVIVGLIPRLHQALREVTGCHIPLRSEMAVPLSLLLALAYTGGSYFAVGAAAASGFVIAMLGVLLVTVALVFWQMMTVKIRINWSSALTPSLGVPDNLWRTTAP